MHTILNLPSYPLKIKASDDDSSKSLVFDIVRKQWVVLTPEERVRQSFILYMIYNLSVPATHICVEYSFSFTNGKPQRADIVVYDKKGLPIFLIECKAPSVKITEDTFTQATRYNAYIKSPYIVVTNGMLHFCAKTSNFIDYAIEDSIPDYTTLK